MDRDAEARFVAWARVRSASLHRTAYLLTGDWYVAEDLVQEALAKTAQHWARIERVEHPDAYVRRMLINEANARWRRRPHREAAMDQLPDSGRSDGTADRAAQADLVAAVRALPARQRTAVVLRYFEQLSEAETAVAMGCSVGTVKSSTHRALAVLRSTLTTNATEEAPC